MGIAPGKQRCELDSKCQQDEPLEFLLRADPWSAVFPRPRLLKLARGTIVGLVSVAVLVAAGWELYRATQREYARAEAERVAQERLALEKSARENAAAQVPSARFLSRIS